MKLDRKKSKTKILNTSVYARIVFIAQKLFNKIQTNDCACCVNSLHRLKRNMQ